jgi:hypothetical protein
LCPTIPWYEECGPCLKALLVLSHLWFPNNLFNHWLMKWSCSMQYLVDPTLLLGGDASLDHVVSHPIQPVVEEVVMPMQSLVDPTLLLESDESTKVISPMQYLVDPTLLLGSDASFDYVFSISSSVPSEQGGIPLSLSMLPPSPRMVSFDWNDLVEPHLPSSAPFQIMVKVNSMGIY